MRRFNVSPVAAKAARSTLVVRWLCGVSHRMLRLTRAGVASPACLTPAMEPVNKEVIIFMSNDSAGAILRTGDTDLACPLVESTEGSEGYDISKLLKETGRVTLDPGFAVSYTHLRAHETDSYLVCR